MENALIEVPAGDGSATQQAMSLSGHLAGEPAPVGSKAIRAIYRPTETTVVLGGVNCGPNLDAAYTQAGSTAGRTCADGALTLTRSGEALEEWNPWGVDSWRVGPLAVLPDVPAGATFKPHTITLDGRVATAQLTPKQPSPFVDRLGSALADTDWTVRPRPGGHSYHKRAWTVTVEQDGAQVTIRLEASLL